MTQIRHWEINEKQLRKDKRVALIFSYTHIYFIQPADNSQVSNDLGTETLLLEMQSPPAIPQHITRLFAEKLNENSNEKNKKQNNPHPSSIFPY